MKQLIILVTLYLSIGAITTIHAQNLSVSQVENAIKNNGKYAMSVNNAMHLKVAVETGEEFKQKSAKIQFEIIISGPVLKVLVAGNDLKVLINRAEQANIKVVACAIAMSSQGINKSDLPAYIEVSKNAAVYLFGLQELGFKIL